LVSSPLRMAYALIFPTVCDMILIWNLGVVALIAALGSLFGRSMLTWMATHFTTLPR